MATPETNRAGVVMEVSHHSQPSRPTRHVRTLIPAEPHERLSHLAIDLHTTIAALLTEGAVLVCRYHGRGEDLPEPRSPLSTDEAMPTNRGGK